MSGSMMSCSILEMSSKGFEEAIGGGGWWLWWLWNWRELLVRVVVVVIRLAVADVDQATLASEPNPTNIRSRRHTDSFTTSYPTTTPHYPYQPLSATTMFARRLPALLLRTSTRANSTTALPPLLGTLRTDLKTAMRSKNQVQLTVLRSLLSDIKNAQLSATPPTDDLAILTIINGSRKKAATSLAEFAGAGREDLVAKEKAELAILDEYAALVDTVGEDEIRAAVDKTVAKIQAEGAKVDMGSVIKGVQKELEGKPVVKKAIADIIKEVLSAKK